MTGWLAGVAASTYISGTLLQALIGLVDPAYSPQLWHGTLLVYGVLLLCFIFTTVLGRSLPLLETILLIVYSVGYFLAIIPMVHLAPVHASAGTVFTMFIDGGGWSTSGLSFFVGLSSWAFASLGKHAPVHMILSIYHTNDTLGGDAAVHVSNFSNYH